MDTSSRPAPAAHLGDARAWPWDRVVAGLPDGVPSGALAGGWTAGSVVARGATATLLDDDVLALLAGVPLAPPPSPPGGRGWWIGYLGYQMATRLDAGRDATPRPTPLPHAWAAYFPQVARLVDDRWELAGEAAGEAAGDADRRAWCDALDACADRGTHSAWEVSPFRDEVAEAAHRSAIARALEHIRAGDIYQANICLHLEARLRGSPAAMFPTAEARLPVPHRAFLTDSWGAIASFSPELFLRYDGERLVTAPIKGTTRRSGPDDGQRAALLASSKDRAENAMIVDLMRNDLGRVAVTGSVRADELFAAEAHPGVWHLVSTVSCRPRPDLSVLDVLDATFPPGSVTGAPKIRAMRVIDDLEASPRGAYTGTLFVIDPSGRLTASVIIRTLEIADGRVRLGVGSGIVADSDPAAEYRECLDKARPILEALATSIHPAA